jgi:hypothetical protein
MKVRRDAMRPEPVTSQVRSHRARTGVSDVDTSAKKRPANLTYLRDMERTGIEPVTSGLQSRRSPS